MVIIKLPSLRKHFEFSISFDSHTQTNPLLGKRKLGSEWLSELPQVTQLTHNITVTSTSSSVLKMHAILAKYTPAGLH